MAGFREVAAQRVAGVRGLDEGPGEPSLHLLVEPLQQLGKPSEARRGLGLPGRGGEAGGQAVEGQDEGEGLRVGDDEHSVPAGLGVRLDRLRVNGVGHGEDGEAERALVVEVLRHLAGPQAHLARGVLAQAPALRGIVRRLQPLQLGDARPLAVDREQAPPRQAQGVLDDLPLEGRVPLEHVRGQGGEGAADHALARRAASARAGHHELEAAEAVGGPVELGAAGLLEGLHLGERALGEGDPALEVLGGSGEGGERVLARALGLEAHLLLQAGDAVQRLLQAGRLSPGSGPASGGQSVAEKGGEDGGDEGEEQAGRVHRPGGCHGTRAHGVHPRPGSARVRLFG